MAVFARQAAAAIRAARVQRDTALLLRAVLSQIDDNELTDEQLDTLVSTATAGLDRTDDVPFWSVVDRVAQLRGLSDRELRLVADILEVIAAHASRGRRSV